MKLSHYHVDVTAITLGTFLHTHIHAHLHDESRLKSISKNPLNLPDAALYISLD